MQARSNGALNAYTVCGKSNRHAKLDAMVNFLKLKEKYVYMREVEALMVLMRVKFILMHARMDIIYSGQG